MDPGSWNFREIARDGRPYTVRPIRLDDEAREQRFVASLSDESLYNRVMYARGAPLPEELRRLVQVDYQQTMAFVAVVTGLGQEEFIAVARYACDTPNADAAGQIAEFAVVVTDAWQSRGVGTRIMQILFDYAANQGIAQLYGSVLPSNERIISLLRYLDLKIVIGDDPALLRATIDLRGRAPLSAP